MKTSSDRLAAAAFILTVGLALSAFGVELVLHLAGWEPFGFGVRHIASLVMMLVSGLLIWRLRLSGKPCAGVASLAFVYEVLISLGLAVGMAARHCEAGTGWLPEVSAVCVWIVLFPFIVPAHPKRLCLASLLSAVMQPFGFLLVSGLHGGGGLSLVQWIGIAYPPFLCAGLAVFGAHVVYGMGRELDRLADLGSYTLEEKLGEGGMGEVWRARHAMLARPAAIKLIRTERLTGTPEQAEMMLRRFEREVQVTAALTSPHTIQVYDFGTTEDGVFYYVMELLSGMDMHTLVRQHGPVPATRAVHLLQQACESLAEAHRQGLIHRDIKPGNLFVCRIGTETDFVKVLDFGLVKGDSAEHARAGYGDKLRTMDGFQMRIAGTPAFMAPEMAMGGAPVGPAADVYALACVGFWLLTGRRVFAGDTPMQVLAAHAKDAPPRPSVHTSVPKGLDELLLDCLAKSPSKRPPNADALLGRLNQLTDVALWSEQEADALWEQQANDQQRRLATEVQPGGPEPAHSQRAGPAVRVQGEALSPSNHADTGCQTSGAGRASTGG